MTSAVSGQSTIRKMRTWYDGRVSEHQRSEAEAAAARAAEEAAANKARYDRELSTFTKTFDEVAKLDGHKIFDSNDAPGEVTTRSAYDTRSLTKTDEGFNLVVSTGMTYTGGLGVGFAHIMPTFSGPTSRTNYAVNESDGTIQVTRTNSSFASLGMVSVPNPVQSFTLDTQNGTIRDHHPNFGYIARF